MSKLFKFREWLALDEAADYLSKVLTEPIQGKDILRLALDGHMTISVRLVNAAYSRCGVVVPFPDAKVKVWRMGHPLPQPISTEPISLRRMPDDLKSKLAEDGYFVTTCGFMLSSEQVIELDDVLHEIDGVLDLPLIGAERLDVMQMYESAVGGLHVDGVCLEGAFAKAADGRFYQFVERLDGMALSRRIEDYFPSDLPEDAVIVVRTEVLREFERKIAANERPSEPEQEMPISTKESNSWARIVRVLCDLAKLDIEEHYKAAAVLEAAADKAGVSNWPSKNNVAAKLKIAREAAG